MMDPDSDGNGDLELTEHDQLPDVEEYKTGIGYKSRGGGLMDRLKRPDPDAWQSNQLSTSIDPPNEERRAENLTLYDNADYYKSPEEFSSQISYRQNQKAAQGDSCFWKACAIASFFVLVTVILVLTITPDDEVLDFFHFLKGDTEDYLDVLDYVTRVRGISHLDRFDNTSSAQYLAAQWMAHGDPMQISVSDFGDDTNPDFDMRYVLAVLYFELDGRQWVHQLNFLSGNHICTWFEEFRIISAGDDDFEKDNIVMFGIHGCKKGDLDILYPHTLYLPNNGLAGTIPDELRMLESLESLNLEFNSGIAGNLPVGLYQLTHLTHLVVQWCNMVGPIPEWIGVMTNLKYLGLGNNQLTGSLPTQISNLTNLELLGIDDNQLYGDIEVFKTFRNLRSLYLENNYISGAITTDLLKSWPNLEELDISDSLLEGELPGDLLNHQNSLEVLDLHGNNFVGPFPDQINENYKLEFLALHENQITGIVPERLRNLKKLRHLDISVNSLEFKLPESMEEMTTLEYLFTGTNKFQKGEIPKFLIELTKLRELSMKGNQLTGSIPNFLHYLTDLIFLDFHKNELQQWLPPEFGKLTKLRHLILKDNMIGGQLPSSMGLMSNLEVVLLEQNGFQGNTGILCSQSFRVETFVSDCGAGGGIDCTCCSMCCDGGDDLCNNWDWKGNLDPVWEYGYRRKRYSYDYGPVVWIP